MSNQGCKNYSRFIVHKLIRYGLTALLGIVLVGESVGARAESVGVEVAQQQGNSDQAIRLKAEKLTQEGTQLFQQGTAESLKQAQGKWEKALELWRKVGDKEQQAITILAISRINDLLGYKQKALKLYNQALSLFRKIGDKKGEAVTLNNIGNVYSDLGDKQKALKFYNQALPLVREIGYKSGEAKTLSNIGLIYSDLGDKQQALKFYNKALPLSQEVGDKSQEATTLNNIGLVYSDLGDKQQALKFYNQALPLRRKVGDKSGEAATLNNISSVYSDLGDKQQALKFYNQALSSSREAGDKNGEATTLNNIGGVYSDLGDKQQAFKFYNQALSLSREVEDKNQEATTLNNIGRVYSDLGDKQQAFKFYNQALSLSREVADKSLEATIIDGIGIVYHSLGDKQQALKFYNQALPLRREVEDKSGEATTLSNIGLVYSDLGDKQQAFKFYNQALPLSREVEDKSLEATIINSIGIVYHSLGDKQQALKFYNQALPLSREVEDKSQEATTLNNIGGVYSDLGDTRQALKFYNQALPLSREVEDKSQEATTLNNIGIVYLDLGDKQQALKFYNQALSLSREVGDKSQEAATLNNIGFVYYSLGDKQQALKFHNQALPLNREVGDKSLEAKILSNIAFLHKDNGNLQAALSNSKAAIDIIENLRTKVDSNYLRTSYFANVQYIYQINIDILMALHKQNPSKGYDAQALNASEKSRARGLLELLTEANADIRKGANPQLLAEEKQLQQQIDAKEKLRFEILSDRNKSNDPVSKAVAQRLKTEIENHLNEYKQLQVKIKQSNPKYAALKYPEPLKLPQIQQQLDKDSLLLQYSLGKERSYLWLVSSNSLDVYELPKKEEIEKASINLFCLISQHSSKPPSATGKENACEDRENFKTRRIDLAAEELSKLVLAPVKDKLAKKRLVVVADGALQYIPFAALADPSGEGVEGEEGEEGEEKNTSSRKNREEVPRGGLIPKPLPSQNKFNYQPLLVNHEIINLPSASTIAIQRQELANRKKAPKTLAILADPVFSTTDDRVAKLSQNKQLNKVNQNSLDLELERSALKRSADTFNRQGWRRLLGTRTEAETLLQLLPESKHQAVFDFDANYNWATSSNLNQFRILHFATHGFANDENPELSGIVLSLIDKQGKPVRGYLRMHELFNLDYPADLVVLSACETGLGKNIQGEGLVGLTRGLMYAGAERLVVSLWQVDDEGTAAFMQEFYKEMLQNGKSANVALRATQLKMWRQEKWRNPNYWAAFAFLGEWR